MSILREAFQFYKERKREEKQRKMLIRHDMDFSLLESLIQEVNENPDLRVEIHLADGSRVLLKTYKKVEAHNLINGEIYEEIR
jgi:hypothetical protein